MKWLGEENINARKGILTAGPFAAILTNEYGNRQQVVDTIARERLGLEITPETPTAAMKRGTVLEAPAFFSVASQYKGAQRNKNLWLRKIDHCTYPVGAIPDFIHKPRNPFRNSRVGEIKIPQEYNYINYINNVPEFHYFQVYFQMYVTGFNHCALAFGREIANDNVPVEIVEYEMNDGQAEWLEREAIKIERKIIRRMIKLQEKNPQIRMKIPEARLTNYTSSRRKPHVAWKIVGLILRLLLKSLKTKPLKDGWG